MGPMNNKGAPFSIGIEEREGMVLPRNSRDTATVGARTPQFAKPPSWVQGKLPCIKANGQPDLRFDRDVLMDGEAAAMCTGCPILEECRSRALEEEGSMFVKYRHLVRGGLSPVERAALAKVQAVEEIQAKVEGPTCANGHQITEDNTKFTDQGWRICMACDRERTRRYRLNQKIAAERAELLAS